MPLHASPSGIIQRLNVEMVGDGEPSLKQRDQWRLNGQADPESPSNEPRQIAAELMASPWPTSFQTSSAWLRLDADLPSAAAESGIVEALVMEQPALARVASVEFHKSQVFACGGA